VDKFLVKKKDFDKRQRLICVSRSRKLKQVLFQRSGRSRIRIRRRGQSKSKSKSKISAKEA